MTWCPLAFFSPLILLRPNCVMYLYFDKLKLLQVVPKCSYVIHMKSIKIDLKCQDLKVTSFKF